MGWKFAVKGNKYRIWSTITDSYLTGWKTRSEMIKFCFEDRLREFKTGIIELYLSFPDKRGKVNTNQIIMDEERRHLYHDWLSDLHDVPYEEYDEFIDAKFQEALDSFGGHLG